MRTITALSLSLVIAAAAACAKQDAVAVAKPAAPAPAVAQSTPPPAAPAAGQLTGKVAETFNSGGYTYLRVATPTGDQWAAVGETRVAKGDDVAIGVQMTMENFKSSSLNRTFDRIVFGTMGGAAEAPATSPAVAGMPAGHPPAGGKMPAPMTSAMGTASQHMKTPDVEVKVEKAAGGLTVAEIWKQKGSLNGREVIVRGKVVKFLAGIMGRNWAHIQDGSGSGASGDNDITVTTDARVAVGDVVTVKGTLAADKDFGAGYKYDVILEKATFTK